MVLILAELIFRMKMKREKKLNALSEGTGLYMGKINLYALNFCQMVF